MLLPLIDGSCWISCYGWHGLSGHFGWLARLWARPHTLLCSGPPGGHSGTGDCGADVKVALGSGAILWSRDDSLPSRTPTPSHGTETCAPALSG
jgi:hypothetical protein